MNMRTPLRRARRNLTGLVSVIITAIWLAALLAGQDWWLPFMLVGYIVIVPVIALLFGDKDDIREWWDEETADTVEDSERSIDTEHDQALDTLRNRYARGELTDEQFERKLDQLLETETLEDIEDKNREMLTEE